MGNSPSKYVTIQTKSTSVTAGSTLRGSILLTVPSNPPSNDLLSGSSLLFIGKEVTYVEYASKTLVAGGRHPNIFDSYQFGKRDILRAVIPLAKIGRLTSNASYEIPFEYNLPEDLPSSFQHSSKNGGRCSIQYKLKLEVFGVASKEFSLNVRSKPYVGRPLPQLVKPVTAPVNLCWCIPKGTVTMAASVSNTRIAPGQQIVIDLGIKNESSSRVEVVTAAIHQRIYWKALDLTGYIISNTWENTKTTTFRVTDEMRAKTEESMREIKEHQKQNSSRDRGPSDDVYRQILNAVRDGVNQVTLTIPSNTITSYAGYLVTVSHSLYIKAKFSSCVADPEVIVPLQIVSGTYESPEMPAPTSVPVATAYPEGWKVDNVTTIPIVQASFAAPVSHEGNGQMSNSPTTTVPSDAPELPTPTSIDYTFAKLLEKLSSCLTVKSKLEELLIDPRWKSVLSSIQPYEFDAVIKKVMLDFDKVDVASLLCPHIQNFTCVYAVAVLRSVSHFLRIEFLQTMLPNIVDLDANKSVLFNELSEWERVCTERDFEIATSRPKLTFNDSLRCSSRSVETC